MKRSNAIHIRDLPPSAREAYQLKPQRAASYLAQARGDDAEDLVARVHESEGFRCFANLSRRFARQRRSGNVMVYAEPQGPDFSGWLLDGRATHVEVEVKHVTGAKGYQRFDFSRITDRQTELLTACRRDGRIAVVLMLYGPVQSVATWCPVPWSVIEKTRATGRASLPEAVILEHAVQSPEYYLRAPWIGAGR
jgi:hypothetical protein